MNTTTPKLFIKPAASTLETSGPKRRVGYLLVSTNSLPGRACWTSSIDYHAHFNHDGHGPGCNLMDRLKRIAFGLLLKRESPERRKAIRAVMGPADMKVQFWS
jgi:hypothetical protein